MRAQAEERDTTFSRLRYLLLQSIDVLESVNIAALELVSLIEVFLFLANIEKLHSHSNLCQERVRVTADDDL